MADAVFSTARPSGVRGFADGNKKVRYLDLTSDTGNYRSGGTTVTAAAFGLRHIDFVTVSGSATSGTAGATSLGVGIRYASDGTSVTVQLYEGGGAGVIGSEKTDNEAMPSNFTVRLRAEG
jgi:hypothetical protein